MKKKTWIWLLTAVLFAVMILPEAALAGGRTTEARLVGDINGDGEITAQDRMILARYLAGWEGYDKWFTDDGTSPESDRCGDALTWEMLSDGTLVISGSGAMLDFTTADPAPWKDAASEVRALRLSDGITVIGSRAFADCPRLMMISIPASVTEIAGDAFAGSASRPRGPRPPAGGGAGAAAAAHAASDRSRRGHREELHAPLAPAR